ncbi:MAG: P1 family peptidase [Anaerolineales bacterium]|nr:P1 family peptidase [Anaerolineales bacterium]
MPRPRARELGIVIGTLPTGPHNAITDVPGVRVGHTTLIAGDGPLEPGVGPIRTGVTAIHPHAGNIFYEKVPAFIHAINGFGEVTNSEMVKETGVLESPILLTGTTNVPRVADGVLDWFFAHDAELGVSTWTPAPVVAECSDQYLHDMRGRHIRSEHVAAALDGATTGPVAEGGVGGGTGMMCCGFKGGIGTSSRVTPHGWTLGVLVMSNFGRREHLRVDGVPVGRELRDWELPSPPGPLSQGESESPNDEQSGSSIIIVVGTDAPLDTRQLQRVAVRAGGGLARAGGLYSTTSGDFVIAFSNGNRVPHAPRTPVLEHRAMAESLLAGEEWPATAAINTLFQAALEATEEAILNSVFVAETMVGRDGNTLPALPLEEVMQIMKRYGHNLHT